MQHCYPVGISLTRDILKKIDAEREDIPRSKFVLRILEKRYQSQSQDSRNGHE